MYHKWLLNGCRSAGCLAASCEEFWGLKKKDKTIIKEYIGTMTGMKKAQATRLIKRKKNLSIIVPRYNLRETRQYESNALTVSDTKAVNAPIGQRLKPSPYSQPGYLRVDTVHQGDLNKEKGVYHINLVDETTQWEIVGAVEEISEQFFEPLLVDLLNQFPFGIINFHSDNGSEYINKITAKLLNTLLIRQTKSRTYHSNDNTLAETKNGSVIRKNIGYTFINRKEAPSINEFYRNYFNVYLNYHRPCGFAREIIDKKGKSEKSILKKITPLRMRN